MCGRNRCIVRLLAVLAAGLLIAVVFPGWVTAALLIVIAGIAVLLYFRR